jgi:hypothetical protein
MADVIHKYGPIDPTMDWITCKGYPVYIGLHVDGKAYVWCRKHDGPEVNTERTVKLVATGEPYIGPYYGTFIYPTGLVYHLVEV